MPPRKRLTVVISQAPGKNPVKRQLEEALAVELMTSGLADVSLIPNLYDLPADHTGLVYLRSVPGDLVVLGWLYPRAIHWTLDRQKVYGRVGTSLLVDDSEEDLENTPSENEADTPASAETGIGSKGPLKRTIWAIDLRVSADPNRYLDEIRRINAELNTPMISIGLTGLVAPRKPIVFETFGPPLPSGSVSESPSVPEAADAESPSVVTLAGTPLTLEQLTRANGASPDTLPPVRRRWYPVIDYSRCTNCMECIDFCLFGVYGVDATDRILVEQQDNCKKGCPACSRVCPANAIIFPEHKTAAIAGSDGDGPAAFKIDLSKLFGGDDGSSALEQAAKERDAELVAAGRAPVGTVPAPSSIQPTSVKSAGESSSRSHDDLDAMLDALDSF